MGVSLITPMLDTSFHVTVTIDPVAICNFVAIFLNFQWLRRALHLLRRYDLDEIKAKLGSYTPPLQDNE